MNTGHIPRYSYTDYVQWPGDWELIDGHPYSMLPSPAFRHGKLLSRAVLQAGSSMNAQHDCNCLVLFEQDWRINKETVVRPDMMIICGEPKGDVVEFPPVFILEVLSPATRHKDRNIKFQLYQEQGVRYYLMADYERHILEVYELTDNVYREVQRTEFLLEPGCSVTLEAAELWK
jgi:Uma2 family endonuclease